MLDILRRLAREPAALVGAATAGLGLTVLFGAPITLEQTGGILAFIGALMFLLRFILTPAGEVLVQRGPDGALQLGAAADNVDLAAVPAVDQIPYIGQHRRTECGANDTQTAVIALAVLVLAAIAAAVLLT